MPWSAVHTFGDPDDYAAAIRAGTAEVTVTGRGQFSAKRLRIDFHGLWMQRFSESLPRVLHAVNMRGRAGIMFCTRHGSSPLARGVQMQVGQITRYREGEEYYQVSTGPVCFGAMSLPVEEIASLGATMAGCDLSPPRHTLTITPLLGAIARLQRLHAAAEHSAENAPEIIANPDAARGLEQALLEAMVDCLGNGEAREDTVAHGSTT